MIRAAVVFFLCAAAVVAKETPEQAAEKVLAAKDAAALKVLAARDNPDPWRVADVLCARGEHDAAEAFAKAAPRKDVADLPAYVAAQRGKPARTLPDELDGADTAVADVTSVRILVRRASAQYRARRLKEAAATFLAAADAAERIGWWRAASAALAQAGQAASRTGNWRGAVEASRRRVAVEQARGESASLAGSLINLGSIEVNTGALEDARRHLERGLALAEKLGHRRFVANALGNLGNAYSDLGLQHKAMATYVRALKMFERMGNRRAQAISIGNIALAHENLGNVTKAIAMNERALEMMTQLQDEEGVARTLINLGGLHSRIGAYPAALDFYERGLKQAKKIRHGAWIATALGSLGLVHRRTGDRRKAMAYYASALQIYRKIGDRPGLARTLVDMAGCQREDGDVEGSLARQRQALALFEAMGSKTGVATTLGNMANTYRTQGDFDKAIALHRRALALKGEESAPIDRAFSMTNIGTVLADKLAFREALTAHQRAYALADGFPVEQARALSNIAVVQHRLADFPAAITAARKSVAIMSRFASGLGEEQGAGVRSLFASTFDVGVMAAVRARDLEATAYFLERGRAGALLESLGGRQALRGASLSPALLEEEESVRAAETRAENRYRAALKRGKRKELRRLRGELDRAREARHEFVQKIQRTGKAAANLLYPEADSLADIRAALRPGEALVLYFTHSSWSAALVATRNALRIVTLATAAEIERASKSYAQLRKLVIDPLKLGPEVKRVLVSAHGPLSYVPFSALTECEVVHVPSGTTYRFLRTQRSDAGKDILGIGDPDYTGSKLARLPATRAEVEAIAGTKLLGRRATKAGLKNALAEHGRWRAVHFACHGLIDTERPARSGLALMDGRLTALDVFRLPIAADLVVLSACETGKGKVVAGEGILGLTRAFMFAGAPRVIVSLWKVDDDATKALMVKFYELWARQPAATALRRAQEYVASQEKWKDPHYWAAWQLWGLGD